MNIETLLTQLDATKQELEQARAHVYRCDGVIQMLEHMIAQEKAEASKEASIDPPKD